MLSVVIPTRNEAGRIAAAIAALEQADGLVGEVVVADAGDDETGPLAVGLGARVLRTRPGRGVQLAAGARAARMPWLLFLHADTRLGRGWADVARRFMAEPRSAERAGVFRLRFDDPHPAARRLEAAVLWRTRRLGLAYGDQGLLIGRRFYEALGGFRPLVLMEDVDLVRRIGRRRLYLLDADALTSAERYRREGYLARAARNLACLGLYYAGLPAPLIARLYG